jgi:hypothetical protein
MELLWCDFTQDEGRPDLDEDQASDQDYQAYAALVVHCHSPPMNRCGIPHEVHPIEESMRRNRGQNDE